MSSTKPVIVRQVYDYNVKQEFALIRNALCSYTYVTIDTEFPGTVFRSKEPQISPSDVYLFMKINVESTKLIQLGLTLSDSKGNLPDFGTNNSYIWEFNFKEFDITKDLHNKKSIELLREQGINFEKNREQGVRSEEFASYFIRSGFVLRGLYSSDLTWVTFQSAYDFGYLLKALRGRALPRDLNVFMECIRVWFGFQVYDMKEMMRCCEMYGGLESAAKHLKVDRAAGKRHQAGSDSLLTMQTFMKFEDKYFDGDKVCFMCKFNCKLYGLVVK